MQKVLIWGTGIEYDNYLTLIKFYEEKKQFSVAGVTSNDNYYHTLDGYSFIQKENIMNIDWDWILVCANDNTIHSIREEAISMGISEDVVFSAHIMLLPGFDFEKYVKLAQSKLTIFSSNCWGGVVYKRLGLKVRSPLYNMGFDNEYGFLQFLSDPRRLLLNEVLQFEENGYNERSKHYYPIYQLDGIRIRMLHDRDRERVEKKWNERVQRINWDNLFIMMYSDDERCIERFSEVSYKKKVCFTSLNVDIPYAYYLPLDQIDPGRQLWEIVMSSAKGQYKLYDLMDMLMTGNFENSRID